MPLPLPMSRDESIAMLLLLYGVFLTGMVKRGKGRRSGCDGRGALGVLT